MTYADFLTRVIADGIAAAHRDYPTTIHKSATLNGALDGFSACSNKSPQELRTLLQLARSRTILEYRLNTAYPNAPIPYDIHYARCFEAEVEWVCDVVSAMLIAQGELTIIDPTAHGVLKANDILNETDTPKPSI